MKSAISIADTIRTSDHLISSISMPHVHRSYARSILSLGGCIYRMDGESMYFSSNGMLSQEIIDQAKLCITTDNRAILGSAFDTMFRLVGLLPAEIVSAMISNAKTTSLSTSENIRN